MFLCFAFRMVCAGETENAHELQDFFLTDGPVFCWFCFQGVDFVRLASDTVKGIIRSNN